MKSTGIGGWLAGAALALALFGLGGACAHAQDGSDQEARGLFLAGQAAFEDARYEDALRYFRQAYERSARPQLLYNVGIAADRLRRDEEALEAFEGYLAGTGPEASLRRDVEARIAVLRVAIAEREAAEAAQAAAAEPEPEREPEPQPQAARPHPETPGPDVRTIGGWSLVGGGAAVAIAGAVLLGAGRVEAARVESAEPGTPWVEVSGSAANAEWMSPTGLTLVVVGVAAAAGGALWLALDASEESPALRVGLGLGGISLSGEM